MTARGKRIGAVLADLSQDFPDLTISKIRFLEAEGLIDPQRAGSGYRYYTRADVDRLRFVLTAQRERFWPLKVIREALDGIDRGLSVSESAASSLPRPPDVTADPDLPSPEELIRAAPARLSRAELARATGAEPRLIDDLRSYGLLRAGSDGYFAGESARIVAAARQLAGFGIEARHLRPFRTAADREVGLVEYAVTQSGRPAPEVLALACLALHTALVKDALGADR